MTSLKQQVYFRFSMCLFELFTAILMAFLGIAFLSGLFAMFGMVWLVMFLDVWLEPEKWRQKQ